MKQWTDELRKLASDMESSYPYLSKMDARDRLLKIADRMDAEPVKAAKPRKKKAAAS